ncbi:MAG TPA: hypothetical protein VN783_07000 [Thermoanaerobaculia bacterium]|nr:hypothetical protein [Thermoanaerobaculia bacterium]
MPQHVRKLVIEHGEEYQDWAMCERLCEECLALAGTDPARAQEVADLAVSIAEMGAEGPARRRLTAYSLAFAASVDRAAGDDEEAAEKLRVARETWQAGDGSDPLDSKRFEALVAGQE